MDISSTEVYRHRELTIKLALAVNSEDIGDWLRRVGYYPEAYVLPPFFNVDKFEKQNDYYSHTKKRKKRGWQWEYKPEVENLMKISYPSDGLTSRTFSIQHPKHYNDLTNIVTDSYKRFIKTYKAKRIFSFTFPFPLSSNAIGEISDKRSERLIYEYIEAAEKSLLIDSANYEYVVIADIKQFYPSIYTHSISWAIHTKKTIREDNTRNYGYIGNRIDKLIHYSNDRKTNGIAVGPAISDVISEWLLNAVDDAVSKRLPSDCFGIRFKDDYRIVCHSVDEAKNIISILQNELNKYDLNLSDEKTNILSLPDGLYRPWMLEYDQFIESIFGSLKRNERIPFRSYILVQRKVFEMNKDYSAKGVTEKFLSRLIDDDCRLLLDVSNTKNARLLIANLVRLISQKPKVIGQVLGIFEDVLAFDANRELIQKILNTLTVKYTNNEFMLCWLYYFAIKNHLSIKKRNDKEMPFLLSLENNRQKFFAIADINLISKIETVNISISEHVALFKQ